jgi:hypothetical protein
MDGSIWTLVIKADTVVGFVVAGLRVSIFFLICIIDTKDPNFPVVNEYCQNEHH